jgi:hypothetical protein
MNSELTGEKVKSNTLRLFSAIEHENLHYIYRGNFSKNFTKNVIALAENNFKDQKTPDDLKRKVYHVMVEGVQNISRHQAATTDSDELAFGFFTIKRETGNYCLTTGNLVENSHIENLRERINKVNNLSKEELKAYHKEVLRGSRISERGGAGLGLIDIARRAGAKLNYQFKTFSPSLSFYYLQTDISSEQSEPDNQTFTNRNSLLNVINLHPLLNEEDISIVFCNSFYQEHLLDMLSFLENQMADSNKLKRQIFNIMLEMFQNILKHASNIDGSISEEKKGIFYISETDKNISLTSGNYIESSQVRSLRGKLNFINNQDKGMLEKFYKRRLFDLNINTHKSAGLGLIDLRNKSGNRLLYDFQRINKDYSFYTLIVQILKQA